MVILLSGSSISGEDFQSSLRMTAGFLVTSLAKALLAQLLILAEQPTNGRVPVVPNLFNFTIIQATVLLGTLEAFWFLF